VPIVIKLQDIDEAIENLRYKNETTLKSRLLRAVRQYYSDDDSAESLQTIDAEELVKTVWETGDDRDLLKTKRKNFSSLKSSVNSDLKKLYVDGKNPQGIVIGPENIFAISNEAKDKALAGIMDVFKEKGIDTQSKVSEILSALSDILSTTAPGPDAENTKEEIDRLKNILGDISGKLGLSLQDIIRRTAAADSGELSIIDKGLQGLALEAANAAAGIQSARVKESVSEAFSNIVQVLKDAKTDAAGKAKKIMAAVEGMLSEAIDASGEELSGDQAGKIKEIFHDIIEGREEAVPAADKAETSAARVHTQLLSDVNAILADAEMSASDKISKIMSAVNEMIGEALASAGSGLGDEDKARIREMMGNITGNLDALGRETLDGMAAVGDKILAPVKKSIHAALDDIVQILKDTEADAAGKAKKIMADVEEILTGAIADSGRELPDDQAGRLKEIFHQMAQGAGETPPAEATSAQIAGGELLATVSSILGEGGLSAGDKISKIMSAVNELIGETLTGESTGLSDEDKTHIREMMANITGNLDTLGQEALAGFEVVEEEIEAGGEEAVEIVEEIVDEAVVTEDAGVPPTDEAVEIAVLPDEGDLPPEVVVEEITVPPAEVVDEGFESADGTEEFAEELELAAAASAELLEEITEAGLDEFVGELEEIVETDKGPSEKIGDGESAEEIAVPPDEVVEIVEDVAVSPDEVTEEDLKTGTEETIGARDVGLSPEEMADLESLAAPVEAALSPDEVIEVVDEAAIASDVVIEETEAAAGDEGVEFVDAGIDDTTVEVVEEIVDEAAAGESVAADAADLGAIEQSASQDFVEEVPLSLDVADLPPDEVVEEISLSSEVVVEETDNDASDIQVITDGKKVDDDLREKTELLTRLAQAAGALTAMGPDLSGNIYTEEEIREKAKFLSEEFDRYLSIRNRFYNAHILIKGGDYLVGGAHLAKSELAEQIVTLPDFYISKFPVTNSLFEIFVEQTGYITTAEKYGFSLVYFPRMQRSRDPVTGVERFSLHNQAYSKKVPGACWHQPFGPGSSLHLKRTHPVVQVSVDDARAFAAWTGKRLPTEIEWEAAARTAKGLIYPWGSQWQDDACNIEKSLHGDTAPVDKYVKFANSAEVADTLGNVLEWTSDVIGDREAADTYIVKGASWISHGEISLTDRHYIERNVSSNILGFRCVAI
jgi:formylglycine-generating enzyme required for sulfatase activity/ElaB/YqjD/DUF883 family membrane-anchored ribosome-binding protein